MFALFVDVELQPAVMPATSRNEPIMVFLITYLLKELNKKADYPLFG